MGVPKKVRIRELGPREGFQTLSKTVSTEQKLDLIALLGETGVSEIEVTSFVRPDKVPQMADAEEVVSRFVVKPNVKYTALYLNPKGFLRAEGTNKLTNEGWLTFAVSDTFFKKNSNTTLDHFVSAVPNWVAVFRAAGKGVHGLMVSTAFGCAYEGKIKTSKVISDIRRVVDAVSESGETVREISLADTVGMANPDLVRRVISELRSGIGSVEISLHLHDTRGTGLANAYAGMLEGVSCFDASVGGVGGCPFTPGAAGNIATEDLVYLCEEMGINTGINLARYIDAARFTEKIVGASLPGKLYKVKV